MGGGDAKLAAMLGAWLGWQGHAFKRLHGLPDRGYHWGGEPWPCS